MAGSTVITLSNKAVKTNVDFIKKKIGQKTRLSAVVKANAYGHGITQIVPLFEKHGVDHFSVFDYQEAVKVYNALNNKNLPIMIMGWIEQNDLDDILEKGFEFFIFNVQRLERAIKLAKQKNTKAKIHVEVETGMNRSGVHFEDIERICELINTNPKCLEVKGLCTHLAGAESISNYKRIIKQLKTYNKFHKKFIECGVNPEYRHVACSAGAFVYPKARMDLVRIGIMLYGFWPSIESFILYSQNRKNKTDPLERVLKWKSEVMTLNSIKEGNFVGYGVSYLTQRDTKTAVIPVGYSRGYNRSLSNKGRVIINGHVCEVIGTVNMNMIIVNVTDIEDVKVGDEVVIIGTQGDQEIKVAAFTDFSDELNYEVLARLPGNIKREVQE